MVVRGEIGTSSSRAKDEDGRTGKKTASSSISAWLRLCGFGFRAGAESADRVEVVEDCEERKGIEKGAGWKGWG